jgi:hypothetical protein
MTKSSSNSIPGVVYSSAWAHQSLLKPKQECELMYKLNISFYWHAKQFMPPTSHSQVSKNDSGGLSRRALPGRHPTAYTSLDRTQALLTATLPVAAGLNIQAGRQLHLEYLYDPDEEDIASL